MKKLVAVLAMAALGTALLGLSSCGEGGKEGGTLKGTFASFPQSLDPSVTGSAEAWTALYDTYIPLLTYAHASGSAGSKVVPGLAKSLPKIGNGGRTYTLFLREGLEYSNGKPVKASDFAYTVERLLALNSGGTAFYTDIVGAEKFAESKKGGISGIKTNDRTGEISIELVKPRGTFTNELALMYVALLPSGTPDRDLTSHLPPATGPYEIVKTEPGRGWSYVRNPVWAKVNSKLMPELPSGHVDKIEISIVRNHETQVNEVETGKTDWMASPPAPSRFAGLKRKYEGSQFRAEPTISTYYFWMNTTKAPFNDLKVRQAVNYAVDTEALERIYAGQLKASHQILPEGMPGHQPFNLYPHDMAKAKKLIEEAHPADRNITVWTDNEPENSEASEYYQDVLRKLGFNTKLKKINADNYFTFISNRSTPELDTGFADWFEDYPHPNDFFERQLSGKDIMPTSNYNWAQLNVPALNEKIARLEEEPLGPKQEGEYAALDRAFMEQAPWVPYGTRTLSTFVSSAIDLNKVVFNPTFGQDLTSFQFK